MVSSDALTVQFRRQQLALRAVTLRELMTLWPALDWTRLDATFPSFALSVGRLVQDRRSLASGLAGDYLTAFREAKGIPGQLRVVIAAPAPPEQLLITTRVTTVVAAKKAAAAGIAADAAMRSAFVQVAGSVGRLVLDGARDTVRDTVRADDRAYGWQRVTSGRSCEFCAMLAGRGAVYKESTSSFESHGHCACTAEPVYH